MLLRTLVPMLAAAVLCGACTVHLQPEEPEPPKIVKVGEWPKASSLGRISDYQEALEADPSSVAIRIELTKAYATRGQWAEAIEQGKLAVQSDPNSAEAGIVLAHAYANTAAWANCLHTARTALLVDPSRADGRFALGWCFLGLSQWNMAKDALQDALTLRPDYFDALRGLGTAAARLQDYPTALKAWDDAVALRPSARDLKKTIDDLRAVLGKNLQPLRDQVALRPNDWAAYSALGDRAAYFGLFGEALPAYYEAARLGVDQTDPARSAGLYYNIGVVYRQMEDFDQALLMLDRAILLDKTNAAAHYNVGLVYVELGDHAQAVAAFERAVVHERHSVTPFIALADAYLRLGQVSAALNQYQVVKDADPRQAEALLSRIEQVQKGS